MVTLGMAEVQIYYYILFTNFFFMSLALHHFCIVFISSSWYKIYMYHIFRPWFEPAAPLHYIVSIHFSVQSFWVNDSSKMDIQQLCGLYGFVYFTSHISTLTIKFSKRIFTAFSCLLECLKLLFSCFHTICCR